MKQDEKDLWVAIIGTVLSMAFVIGFASLTALVTFYARHGSGQ